MQPFSLKRLLSKKETRSLVETLTTAMATAVYVRDREGQLVLGNESTLASDKFPILLESEEIGWVFGSEAARAIATLISHLATKEQEKKRLAQETLDRYKEITLLYEISDKISDRLDLKAVGEVVLNEARRLIQASSGVLVLCQPDQPPTSVSRFGAGFLPDFGFIPSKGIIGSIYQSGNGEIVNQVDTDARHSPIEACFSSLLCTPLKVQQRIIGLLCLGNDSPVTYTAADLKLCNALASQAAAALENVLLHESKLREERIKSNLERYVPAQLVQAISKGEISLAPRRQQIAILFSDIRNFTAHCEAESPETIVGHLNTYFTQMVEVIFCHQGTINKFVGDMIVALFGAPSELADSEKQAIKAAIAMQQNLRSAPVEWIRENFHTGIGISSGKVIVGNIGSPQHMDYTAIGDEVNTASRLQSIAQGGQILVSRAVYEVAKDDFCFKEVGSLTVKGKRNTVDVFEVIYR